MKKILISLSVISIFLSFSSQSITIEELRNNKDKLNTMTEILCDKIDKEVMVNKDKMICLNIINEGFKVNNFYSYYVFYKSLKNKINTNREVSEDELNSLYSKMNKINKTEKEESLFINLIK